MCTYPQVEHLEGGRGREGGREGEGGEREKQCVEQIAVKSCISLLIFSLLKPCCIVEYLYITLRLVSALIDLGWKEFYDRLKQSYNVQCTFAHFHVFSVDYRALSSMLLLHIIQVCICCVTCENTTPMSSVVHPCHQ